MHTDNSYSVIQLILQLVLTENKLNEKKTHFFYEVSTDFKLQAQKILLNILFNLITMPIQALFLSKKLQTKS